MDTRLLAGSNWDNSSYCGSRTANVNNWDANAWDNNAARGASDTLDKCVLPNPTAGPFAMAMPKYTTGASLS